MNNGELQPIESKPHFEPDLDEQMLQRAAQKKPEITHLIKRLSVETKFREWSVERILEHNRFLLRSEHVNEEVLKALKELRDAERDTQKEVQVLSKALLETDKIARESQQTILDWTIKFKSPLTLLGGLIGIIVTGIVGAIIGRWLK